MSLYVFRMLLCMMSQCDIMNIDVMLAPPPPPPTAQSLHLPNLYLSIYLSVNMDRPICLYISSCLNIWLSPHLLLFSKSIFFNCLLCSVAIQKMSFLNHLTIIYHVIFLSMYISIYLSVYLSIYLSIYRSIYLYINFFYVFSILKQTDSLTDWQTDRLIVWQTDRLTDLNWCNIFQKFYYFILKIWIPFKFLVYY